MVFFRVLSVLISLYSFMCILRVLFTWIPSLNASKFTKFISDACDPYLRLFYKVNFLRIGNFDFSPILAIAILGLLANIFDAFSTYGRFALGTLLASIIGVCWSLCSIILLFFTIVVIIRIFYALFNKPTFGNFWAAIDKSLLPLKNWINNLFFKEKPATEVINYLIVLVCLILINSIGGFLIRNICFLLAKLPF